MKSRTFKTFTFLSTCVLFVIVTMGLTLAACDTGAGRAPTVRIIFRQGEGGGTAPSYMVKERNEIFKLPDVGQMTPPGGKVFHGWMDPNIARTIPKLGDYYTLVDVELTAQWRDSNAAVYTVSFDSGDGGGVTSIPLQAMSQNMIYLPPQGMMTAPAGKVFDGWRGSDGRNYAASAAYSVSANISFTAQWRDAGSNTPSNTTYTVTFDGKGVSGSPPNPITVEAGKSITIPGQGGMTASGLTFRGWSPDQDGSNARVYSPGESFTPTRNITLYAWWYDNSTNTPTVTYYTVTFNGKGVSGSPPSPITVEAGKSITIPGQGGMTASGLFFRGWSPDQDGSYARVYSPGESFTPTGNITLYAWWRDA